MCGAGGVGVGRHLFLIGCGFYFLLQFGLTVADQKPIRDACCGEKIILIRMVFILYLQSFQLLYVKFVATAVCRESHRAAGTNFMVTATAESALISLL